MEREANYTAVGAFVLLVIAMAGFFVYWYTESSGHRDYMRYEVYFDGSVAGLTQGASVRYLGVDVGRVVDMDIDKRNASRVQVIIDVQSDTPISGGTTAELSQQGVTGVLYIDLLSQPGSRSLLESVPSEKYPVIRSSRSDIDQLLANLPEMVGRATAVLDRIDKLLDESNEKSFSETFAHLDATTAQLPQTMSDLRTLMSGLRATSDEIQRTAGSVRGMAEGVEPQLHATLANFADVSRNLSTATGNLNQMIGENRADLRAFTRDGLPQLTQFVGEGRSAVAEVRDLAHSLRADPSQLLLEKPEQGVLIPP